MAQNQNCTIKGYLYGGLCDEMQVMDRIAGAEIYAVRSQQSEPSTTPTGDNPDMRLVIRRVTEDQLKQITSSTQSVMSTTDDEGTFCLSDPNYNGELLDLYACVSRVPMPMLSPNSAALPQKECFYMGTMVPVRSEDTWLLMLKLPRIVWTGLKLRADAWTIIGRVNSCDGGQPIGNVTVTAFDVDIVQNDTLGSATTDGSGMFRIDFPGASFRRGTIIDIELFGGPDVYFRIDDAAGNNLLLETPSFGRLAGRAERGPVFCASLCVNVPVPGDTGIQPAWTSVGTDFTIPDAGSLNDFDNDGYAGAPKYALTSIIRMTGSAPIKTSSGNHVEYRFRVSDVTAPNSAAPLAEANFSRIVGKSPDDNLFIPIKIGQMVRYSPFRIIDVYARLVDLDADGWLDPNTSIMRTFTEVPGVTPADIPSFVWIDSDGLMGIDTRRLTTAPSVPDGAAVAGGPVPAGNRIGIEMKAFRFEVREVINKAGGVFNLMPGHGTTVNSMILNNNPSFMKLGMREHLTSGDLCGVLHGDVHVAYTVHHPHLSSVYLNIRSNDASFNFNLQDAPQNLPLAGNILAAINMLNNPSLAINGNPGVAAGETLHKCTYLVTLAVQRRLHNGDVGVGTDFEQITFYYEP